MARSLRQTSTQLSTYLDRSAERVGVRT
jgi:hypothetical protein